MGSRLELQELLETLTPNVYYQPPPSFMMTYPCIVYSLSDIRPEFANNKPYKLTNQYSLTVIDADPDSSIRTNVSMLPMCIFDRRFTSANLNHNVFTISY